MRSLSEDSGHLRIHIASLRRKRMASSSREVRDPGVLTPEYMALLASLCRVNCPTVNEIAAIFTVEFRRALNGGRTRMPSGHVDSHHKKVLKRPGGDPDDGGDDNPERYDRSCTWGPGRPCWLSADLERWNRLLSKGCFELWEHVWTELTIQGFTWSEFDQPRLSDLLRVSLLIHFLLRQHRCVKRVIIDFNISSLQEVMFWDAIRNSTAALTYFEFQLTKECQAGQPVGDIPGTFLEAIALNKTLKKLRLCDTLLKARNGEALATFVRNHTVIESIEVTGVENFSPSALLKAAVQSQSLRRLHINSCTIKARDIEEMAKELTQPPASPASGKSSPPGPASPSRCLEELGFYRCFGCDPAVEGAYASLIGGKQSLLLV
ncbi:hypothetical protein MTO96_026344 [Rhipicephalus appendiculatus]